MIYKNIFGRIVLHTLSLLMTMSQKKKQFGTEHLYFVIIHFKFEILSVLDQLHMCNCPPDCSTDTIDYIYYNL